MARDSYANLQQKIEKEIQRLKKQAEALKARQRAPIIKDIVKKMGEYAITPDEITAAYNKRKTPGAVGKRSTENKMLHKTVPPKYRHPETGATWTGRGKAPRWITDAETAGKSRDSFLIENIAS